VTFTYIGLPVDFNGVTYIGELVTVGFLPLILALPIMAYYAFKRLTRVL
jgi:hypothetical protein